MPAGDLLVADWQIELQGVLTGHGTTYRIGPRRISGLGVPPTKTADTKLDGADGSVGSPDHADVRILIVDYVINATTNALAFDALEALSVPWSPVSANVELHVRLPGWGHVMLFGRPRGLEPTIDDSRFLAGVLPCIAEFHALDPTIYTVP